MIASELSRPVDVRHADGKSVDVVATQAEREALATRFDLVRVNRLEARIDLVRRGQIVEANGTVHAAWVQTCAVSAEELTVTAEEPLAIRFVPQRADVQPDEEIEIDADDCDEIEYDGSQVDVGEAVAQTLGLAIDPYLAGPQAEEARRRAGIVSPESQSPFAALSQLKGKDPE